MTQNSGALYHVNFPKWELPKFDGDSELRDTTKFTYLLSCLTGNALNAIDGLAVTAANYSAAIEILKSCFSRRDLIIQSHIRKLLGATPCNDPPLETSRKFYNEVVLHIRALEALGKNPSSPELIASEVLLDLFKLKVHLSSRKRWEALILSKLSKASNLEAFLRFLQDGIRVEESFIKELDGLKNPIDYFKHFITDEIISLIVEQTNLYAVQQGSRFENSNKEIEIFLKAISNRMSDNRFTEMLRLCDFNDNNKVVVDRSDPSFDRWFKIRHVLQLFLTACKSTAAICATKPQKWGSKVFARCGVSGFLCDFLFYDGRHSTKEATAANRPSEVVLKLCESLLAHKNYKLREARLEDDATLERQGRGAFTQLTDQTKGVSAVKWFDNKAVLLSSTFSCTQPVVKKKRWDHHLKTHIEVPAPAIIHEYNQHMGGVDLSNMLTRLYRIEHKSRKWYRRIFFWVIGAATTNAWLLYRRHQTFAAGTSKTLDLLAFTASISSSLCLAEKLVELSRRCNRCLSPLLKLSQHFYVMPVESV
ncbi:PiggyBac transposable element-derived protein 3 [Trichinella zimbabwensis]|uniref:PiggyBac transposable element-derived protein 3 n=1 Tax=Trichinella zimbabwensis TaxID=268475 RepID=A0A0V1H5Y4_9BILA|nr:PiggyBac transposable element-derived protein 3 [Trichinella zimbabwensis]